MRVRAEPDAAAPPPPPPPPAEPPASGNGTLAGAAVAVGVALFFFSRALTGPSLAALEAEAVPIERALGNGLPTVVEFYADWCEVCRETAPNVMEVERSLKDRVNFVMLNVDNAKARRSAAALLHLRVCWRFTCVQRSDVMHCNTSNHSRVFAVGAGDERV